MEQRVSLITLGVADLHRSRDFYERLGWKRSNAKAEEIVFFRLEGWLSLCIHECRLQRTQTCPLMERDSAESHSPTTPVLARRLTPFWRKPKRLVQKCSSLRRKPSGAGMMGIFLTRMDFCGRSRGTLSFQ